MKNLRLALGDAFSRNLKDEIHHLTMAGRWWLAYQLSGSAPKVLEALLDDAETNVMMAAITAWRSLKTAPASTELAPGRSLRYYDVSDLLGHYDHFVPDRLSGFEVALTDYPVIEKYRDLLVSDSADEEDAS